MQLTVLRRDCLRPRRVATIAHVVGVLGGVREVLVDHGLADVAEPLLVLGLQDHKVVERAAVARHPLDHELLPAVHLHSRLLEVRPLPARLDCRRRPRPRARRVEPVVCVGGRHEQRQHRLPPAAAAAAAEAQHRRDHAHRGGHRADADADAVRRRRLLRRRRRFGECAAPRWGSRRPPRRRALPRAVLRRLTGKRRVRRLHRRHRPAPPTSPPPPPRPGGGGWRPGRRTGRGGATRASPAAWRRTSTARSLGRGRSRARRRRRRSSPARAARTS